MVGPICTLSALTYPPPVPAVRLSLILWMQVDAENSINASVGTRRRNIEYWGYLPLEGRRRRVLLATMALFIAGYLVLAAGSIATALQLFPSWVVAVVLATDCALHHLARVVEGEWWIIGDGKPPGVALGVVDFLFNSIIWVLMHACPFLTLRNPDYSGPHNTARVVVSSLLEGALVIIAALSLPTAEPVVQGGSNAAGSADMQTSIEAALRMVKWICLPALCISLAALCCFLVAMEPQYRKTMYRRDTRTAFNIRKWEREGPHQDEDRASLAGAADCWRYISEPMSEWIESNAAAWARSTSPPSWYTAEWRVAVRKHAHQLPGDKRARLLAAIGSEADVASAAMSDTSGLRESRASMRTKTTSTTTAMLHETNPHIRQMVV
jgi:hypothetical protein